MASYEFADPFRLRIKKNLAALLEAISIADGYHFDLKGKVFRGRVLFGPKDPTPMIAILETPLQDGAYPTPRDNPAQYARWDLTIQGFVLDDEKNPTDPADILAADVSRALGVEKAARSGGREDNNLFNMRGLVTDLIIGQPVSRPGDELSAKAFFYIPITLGLSEDTSKPYGEQITP